MRDSHIVVSFLRLLGRHDEVVQGPVLVLHLAAPDHRSQLVPLLLTFSKLVLNLSVSSTSLVRRDLLDLEASFIPSYLLGRFASTLLLLLSS